MGSNRNPQHRIVSAYGPDLVDVRKAAIARCRGPYGESNLHSVMADECRKRGYEEPYRVARLCFEAVSDKSFHVIEVGMKCVCLSVGRPMLDKRTRQLWISASTIPDQPLMRGSGSLEESVIWGDATVLSSSGDGAFRTWHLCKHDPNQKHVALGGISDEEAEAFGGEIGIEPWQPRGLRGPGQQKPMTVCPSFQSLARWSKAHPRLAKNSTSTYWTGWGNIALAAKEEL